MNCSLLRSVFVFIFWTLPACAQTYPTPTYEDVILSGTYPSLVAALNSRVISVGGTLTSPTFINSIPTGGSSSATSAYPNFTQGVLIHNSPGGYENLSVNLGLTSYNPSGYAQVNGGYDNPDNRGGIGYYGGIDSVNFYDEEDAPSPVVTISSGVTFDATHAILPAGSYLTPAQIATVPYGTWIQTQDETNPHSGMVTAVSVDGSTLTVDYWTQQGGTAPNTPTGSHSLQIGVVRSIWNQNNVLGIGANSQVAVGFIDEADIINNKGNYNPSFGNTDYRGIDIISKGNYNIHHGVSVSSTEAQGVYNGYEADETSNAGYYVGSSSTGDGFRSDQSTGCVLAATDDIPTGTTVCIGPEGTATFSGNLTVSGGATISGSILLNGLTNIFANLGGHAATGFGTVGGIQVGWNYNTGNGDTDLILNQGAGGSGGLNVYQANGSGTIGNPVMSVSSGGNLSVPGVVSPTNGVIVQPTILGPNSGSTVVLTVATPQVLIVNGGGTLAALTFTLPASPVNGQKVTVTSLDGVSAVSFTSGPTIWNAPTTLASGVSFTLEWSSYLSAWFRTGTG